MRRFVPLVLASIALAVLAWRVVVWTDVPASEEGARGAAQPANRRHEGEASLEAPTLATGPEAGKAARPSAPARDIAGGAARTGAREPRAAGTHLETERPREGEQTVRIRIVGDGAVPVAKAHVNVVQTGWSDAIDAQNAEAFAKLNSGGGGLLVEVSDARAADGSRLPLGWAFVTSDALERGEIEVRLPPEEALGGHVVSRRGLAVPGATVRARPFRDPPVRYRGGRRDVESTATSGEDGAFLVRGLGPGEVTVLVEAPAQFQDPAPLRVRAGVADLRIVLDEAASAVIQVLDAKGAPVAGAVIYPLLEQSRAPGGGVAGGGPQIGHGGGNITDAEGRWRPPGLDPEATYTLRVEPPRGRTDLVPARVPGWRPKDVTVRLESGLAVHGSVRDAQGSPVPHAYIYYRLDKAWLSGNVAKDGTFVIPGLLPGDVTLRATTDPDSLRPDVAGNPSVAEAVVRAGATDVVLTIDPGADLRVVVEGWPPNRVYRKCHLFGEGLRQGRTTHVGHPARGDGSALFQGLEAGAVYTFWIPPEGDNLSVVQGGLRAGTGDVTVRLAPGRTITGRLTLPEDAGRTVIQAQMLELPFQVNGTVEPDGRYEIRGLPPGTAWNLFANCEIGGRWWSATTDHEVPAGGSADLTITRR